MSPQATLNRGYAVVQTADGHVLDTADGVATGTRLTITLHHGSLLAETLGQDDTNDTTTPTGDAA